MNRPPQPTQTVFDAGCLNHLYRGQYIAAEVIQVYPPTPHTEANPRSRMIQVEVAHRGGQRSRVAVPLRRVRA